MHPSSSRAFQRHQEHDLKHPNSADFITTKQNKLPSFIDSWDKDQEWGWSRNEGSTMWHESNARPEFLELPPSRSLSSTRIFRRARSSSQVPK